MLHVRRLGSLPANPSPLAITYSLFGIALSNFSPPVSTSSDSWTARAINLGAVALHVDTAQPAGSNGYGWRYQVDSLGPSGTEVDLINGNTNASGNTALTITGSASANPADSYAAQAIAIGSPNPPGDILVCQSYTDGLDNSLTYMAAGDGATNLNGDVVDHFMGFFRTGGNPTESSFQNVMGVHGVLENLFMRLGFGPNTNTWQIAIRTNGVDQYVTNVTNTGTAPFFSIPTPAMSVTVSANDLASIRFKRTSGPDATFVAYILCTFRAT